MSLRLNKREFNKILTIVWKEFWPVELADETTKEDIKWNMFFIKLMCCSYLTVALTATGQFMTYPMAFGNEMLPLASTYPFNYKRLPYFEIMYIWQYFSNFFAALTLSGYDFFMSAISMNVVAQFQILRDVMKNIYVGSTEERRRDIYEYFDIKETRNGRNIESQLFLKCVLHHKRLLL